MGTNSEDEPWVSAAEAAKALGVHRSSITRLCDRGVLVERRKKSRLYVTVLSLQCYRNSEGLSLRELATKVLMLEYRMDDLYSSMHGERNPEDSQKAERAIKRIHPELFKSA